MKMLVFEHNWHEARLFERRARESGADEVQFVAGNGDESFASGTLASGSQFEHPRARLGMKLPVGRCEQVWQDLYVTPDGGVFACCWGYRDEDLFAKPWHAPRPAGALELPGARGDAPLLPGRDLRRRGAGQLPRMQLREGLLRASPHPEPGIAWPAAFAR